MPMPMPMSAPMPIVAIPAVAPRITMIITTPTVSPVRAVTIAEIWYLIITVTVRRWIAVSWISVIRVSIGWITVCRVGIGKDERDIDAETDSTMSHGNPGSHEDKRQRNN